MAAAQSRSPHMHGPYAIPRRNSLHGMKATAGGFSVVDDKIMRDARGAYLPLCRVPPARRVLRPHPAGSANKPLRRTMFARHHYMSCDDAALLPSAGALRAGNAWSFVARTMISDVFR